MINPIENQLNNYVFFFRLQRYIHNGGLQTKLIEDRIKTNIFKNLYLFFIFFGNKSAKGFQKCWLIRDKKEIQIIITVWLVWMTDNDKNERKKVKKRNNRILGQTNSRAN